MDVLFDNSLANMHGPQFLIFYIFVVVLALVFLVIVRLRIDRTSKIPIRIPSQVDPFEIAYLRGGVNEMARFVVFSLMRKGLVSLEDEASMKKRSSPQVIKRNPQPQFSQLDSVEQIALGWIGDKRKITEIFDPRYGLVGQLENYAKQYQAKLEKALMLTTDEMRSKFRAIALPTCFFVLSGYLQTFSSVNSR